jgi:hypothetical protein
MKKLIFGSIIAIATLAFGSANAQQIGRYQMVPIPRGPNSLIDEVVVLDTTSGDMWSWSESPAYGNSPGFNGIKYLGRTTVGTRPGDIVSNAARH